jgi:hypothetical protein
MKKRILVGFILLCAVFMGPARSYGADISVTWLAATGASGYRLEYSSDNGAGWQTPKDIGMITPVDYTATGGVHLMLCAYTWTGLPDTGLILIRVTAYNASGAATRTDAGAWYNKGWLPPIAPKGVGIP